MSRSMEKSQAARGCKLIARIMLNDLEPKRIELFDLFNHLLDRFN